MAKKGLDRSNVRESMGEGVGVADAPATSKPLASPKGGDVGERLKNLRLVPLDRIVADPDQPREEYDEAELVELGQNMKEHGQLQPATARWIKEADTYMIISGERRLRAARIAGLPALQCVIYEREISPAELLEIQYFENALRRDIRPIEEAKLFRRFIENYGYTHEQLGERLGKTQVQITRALGMLPLPASVREKIDDGTIPVTVAHEIATLDDPADQVAVADKVVKQGLKRDAVRQEVKQVVERKGGGVKKKSPPQTDRVFNGGGYKITAFRAGGIQAQGLLEALRVAVSKMEAEVGEPEPVGA